MNSKGYLSIVAHYERCLEKHGDTYLGVDWPNREDADTRYEVMLEVINPSFLWEGRAARLRLWSFASLRIHPAPPTPQYRAQSLRNRV